MENLSHYQERVIDKIYGKFGRGPLESLEDLCFFYLDFLHNEKDRLIISHFKKEVERNLSLHLASDKRFNNFDSFKENYLEETHNYVSNKCDELGWTGVDGIADLTKACVGELIDQQKSIFDSSVKVYINVKDEEPLDVIQFVSDLFLDKHKFNARLKIDYLNEELNQLKGISKPIEVIEKRVYKNPYPEYFNSYGYELYEKFTLSLKRDIVLTPVSFLVDRLRKDGLMNKDKTLISIFQFMVEEFDTNFGKNFKFKSDYSTKKYLPLYNALVSLFENKD
tara:strand:+ start:127 stop:966 length:840 start_codon:yes stop_codon:yes gene_type:complete